MNRAEMRELAGVVSVAVVAAIGMTWPLALHLGSVGRVDTADGMFSIWNVAWVARTLAVDPWHVFDANIFYPHHATLAYSENNLGAGLLAMPVYWATRNPFAAHNSVVLAAFALSVTGMYYLARHLTGDRAAASVSAVCFAFCPYVFAHTAHIQLLMTAGLPFSMLACHRIVERPTMGRGATLGAVMAATAIACGYYGVFVILMVGFACVAMATVRGLWTNRPFWIAIAIGAAAAILLVLPAFVPYASLQRISGFKRELDHARTYASNWSDYLTSSSYAHAWLLEHLPPWVESGFPGLIASVLGIAGAFVAWRSRRDAAILYGGLALLACWASFGPAGILYSLLYRSIPLFAWLRAPSRFVLIVAFGLSVLAAFSVAAIRRRFAGRPVVGVLLAAMAAAELLTPSTMRPVLPFEPVYRTLATLPPAPVIEMPFYYVRGMYPLHTQYMLNSTTHWMPLVNGYSDYLPPDFIEETETLKFMPSGPALKMLTAMHVRYVVFHLYGYNESNRRDVFTRMSALQPYFRELYADDATRLYEIVGAPGEGR